MLLLKIVSESIEIAEVLIHILIKSVTWKIFQKVSEPNMVFYSYFIPKIHHKNESRTKLVESC